MTIDLLSRPRQRPYAVAMSCALIASVFCPTAAAVQDVLLQTDSGKIATAVVDDVTQQWIPGTGVYPQQFLFIPSVSVFRSANPGFVSFATGNVNTPPGWEGFPSNHDVSFDLLPMSIGAVASNLFYWDGTDLGGDGLDLTDVQFVPAMEAVWEVLDANGSWFAADGTADPVPGGLIAETSDDIDPLDGVDTGSIHKHLVLQVNDLDENSSTASAEGIYMIAWEARSAGFETSDPFLFVHRTPNILNTTRDLAVDWAEANFEMLTSPPGGLPGDYNGNGTIDAADYTVWRDAETASSTSLLNDPTPGTLDASDFDYWRAHFGESLTPSGGSAVTSSVDHGSAVPEPAAAALLVLGFMPIAWLRLRRQVRDACCQR